MAFESFATIGAFVRKEDPRPLRAHCVTTNGMKTRPARIFDGRFCPIAGSSGDFDWAGQKRSSTPKLPFYPFAPRIGDAFVTAECAAGNRRSPAFV